MGVVLRVFRPACIILEKLARRYPNFLPIGLKVKNGYGKRVSGLGRWFWLERVCGKGFWGRKGVGEGFLGWDGPGRLEINLGEQKS